jgi:hypothetical protein
MLIEVRIGHIVDTAACAAHEDRAQRENDDQMPARKPTRRDPQRRQAWPKQQQPSSRAIPADQIKIEGEASAPHGAIKGGYSL